MHEDILPSATIRAAEERLANIPLSPQEMKLSQLLAWVQANDPSFNGQTEEALFVIGYGDPDEGRRKYRRACVRGTDTLMKAFCIARIKRLVTETVHASRRFCASTHRAQPCALRMPPVHTAAPDTEARL